MVLSHWGWQSRTLGIEAWAWGRCGSVVGGVVGVSESVFVSVCVSVFVCVYDLLGGGVTGGDARAGSPGWVEEGCAGGLGETLALAMGDAGGGVDPGGTNTDASDDSLNEATSGLT